MISESSHKFQFPHTGVHIVPANRSRTLEWRRCLRQVHERGGSVEVAIAQDANASDPSPQLVWRVRLLGVSETEILIEQPAALGQGMVINTGISLALVLSIGQNRWMFSTTNLGATQMQGSDRRQVSALRLGMPETVHRCQRRDHYRVETTSIELPHVELWPLLEPKSVLLAERAYAIRSEMENGYVLPGTAQPPFDDESVMPEVGARFSGTLLNLGGGGLGVRVGPEDSQTIARHKVLWMRLSLPPGLQTPICATGKVVHTHIESNHDSYIGVAFDFSFNPSHQRFVVDQICRYIAWQQRTQTQQLVVTMPQRRTA